MPRDETKPKGKVLGEPVGFFVKPGYEVRVYAMDWQEKVYLHVRLFRAGHPTKHVVSLTPALAAQVAAALRLLAQEWRDA